MELPKGIAREDLKGFDTSLFSLNVRPQVSLIQHVIPFSSFFTLVDSLAVSNLPKDLPIPGDLILIHANPWILDTLRKTDYRLALAEGRLVEDLDQEPILPAGTNLIIPDSTQAHKIAASLLSTRIDICLSEYRLRLIRANDTILSCPIRVGRNEKVFLEAVGREVDLRTPTGKGKIVRVWRRPISINLHTGEPYIFTRRDDGRITRMPAIPSLEPMINGRRTGKMIHATTNPATLGTAYSHGCVGVSEADMWVIYFNVPVGSEVLIRE